jgi:hypothetical protein
VGIPRAPVYRGRPLNQPITASPVPSHVRGLLAKVAGAMTTVELGFRSCEPVW